MQFICLHKTFFFLNFKYKTFISHILLININTILINKENYFFNKLLSYKYVYQNTQNFKGLNNNELSITIKLNTMINKMVI